MGEALRGNGGAGGRWSRTAARRLIACALACIASAFLAPTAATQVPTLHRLDALPVTLPAGIRLDAGRFTVVAERGDERLARTLLAAAQVHDTFPGLPKPSAHVLIAVAPDAARFRQWVGPNAPEWGAAIAIPDQHRIVMQGGMAGSDAGDPLVVLRHELAHLALHETMGRLPPRWFDEGYASVAADEWSRESAFATSIGMVWHTMPSLTTLEEGFEHGATRAEWSYALAYRVVDDLSSLDRQHGLANFFAYWKESGAMEPAIRRAFGMTGEQFEKHWQQQTRRRYGALVFATDLSVVLAFFAVLIGPLYVMRRRRDRRRLDAMRAMDQAQERAAKESVLDALLAVTTPLPPATESDILQS